MFYIAEHFLSIQGEGKYAGIPSYFLRTGSCNMTCAGFDTRYSVNGVEKKGCDTFFAVDKAFMPRWQKVESLDFIHSLALLEKVEDVVITGGEPLLFYKDSVFYETIRYLQNKNKKITFETNATVLIDFENYPAYKECIFSLSIKLSNSGESLQKRINEKAIEAYVKNAKDCYFKFTLDKTIIQTSAKAEIEQITGKYDGIDIYCMPVGSNRKQIWQNDKAVFEFCIDNAYRYSDRLHIRVFDDTKGV